MKVIISGSTGFAGSEVLLQCLSHPDITSVCALTRRRLNDSIANHPKLTTIIMKDFLHYSEEVLEQLAGASAAIWTLGARLSPDARTIDVAYSQAAAHAFNTRLAPQLPAGTKFRFIHLSGIFSEQDQDAPLWLIPEPRKSRGASETALLAVARAHSASFEAAVTRSGMILWKRRVGAAWFEWAAPGWFISVETLAAAMIAAARHGAVGAREGILENAVLIRNGRKELGGKN